MSPTPERWQRIVQIMDEAYKDYEDGLVALRNHVVQKMRLKLKEGGVLDRSHAAESLPRERPAPECGIGVREGADLPTDVPEVHQEARVAHARRLTGFS